MDAMPLKVRRSTRLRAAWGSALVAAAFSSLLSAGVQANQQLMSEVDTQAAEEFRYANFAQWLREFHRYAAGQGIDEATLTSALDGLRYRERVIELDRYSLNSSALYGSIWIRRSRARGLTMAARSWQITVIIAINGIGLETAR